MDQCGSLRHCLAVADLTPMMTMMVMVMVVVMMVMMMIYCLSKRTPLPCYNSWRSSYNSSRVSSGV